MKVPDEKSAEAAVAAASKRVSNWERWGSDDILGTLNFVDGDKRRSASAAVRQGESLSLSIEYGLEGPQTGNIGHFDPVAR